MQARARKSFSFFITKAFVACRLIQTVDYEGVAQKRGGDPVRVSIESAAGASGASATPVDVVDAGDGTYRFWLRPSQPGPLVIRASLFGRSLKHSPLTLDVTNQQQVHSPFAPTF